MNSNATIRQHLNSRADIHSVSTEAVELRDDQYVAVFHLKEQFCKPRSLVRTDATGNAFRNNSPFIDRKAGCLNLS